MKEFSLGLDASINGIYLNSETIELLSIIQCKSIEELKEFAKNCSQLDIPKENIANWNEQNIESIRQCFEDLKHLQEEYGINVQITEFDMCLPERYMFDEKGRIRSEDELVQIINSKLGKSGITIGSIADFKSMRMQEIAQIIKETGIDLEGITYWATSDTLDANTQRTNEKTYGKDGKGGINREVAHTRYGGVYSYSEMEQEQESLLESELEAKREDYIITPNQIGKNLSIHI